MYCTMSVILYLFLLLAVIGSIKESLAAEKENVNDQSSGILRFHLPIPSSVGHACEYRRQRGSCQRRSTCKRATRKICSLGLNPVICCLDDIETSEVETSKETQKTRPTTKRAQVVHPTTQKPPAIRPMQPTAEDANDIDITFPGCGTRTPFADSSDSALRNNNKGSEGESLISGLFRGRRHAIYTNEDTILTRQKRFLTQPVIVGGRIADPNTWPWMVAIFKKTFAGGSNRFLCGASLISKRYILSAAHCFDGEKTIDPFKFVISVGAHQTRDGKEYAIENILIHPRYRPGVYYNDISIIKLAREVTLNKKVYPVCLPSAGLRHKIGNLNKNVTVTGWGDTSFGGKSSKVLQEVTFPIVPLKRCNESYTQAAAVNFPKGITDLFICAGLMEGGKDACQGDSGGPLVMPLEGKQWVQLGIVSFGNGCAQAGFPGVYTRVSKYASWIAQNTDLRRK